MVPGDKLVITTRELKEIDHALYYEQNLAHGTTGHNQLMLLAKFARHLGFHFSDKLEIPDTVIADDGPKTGQGSAR